MDQKVGLTVLAVIAIVMVGGSFAWLMELEAHEADTDAYGYSEDLFRGYGSFPDKPGDERKRGEFFYTTKGLTSWLSDGKSQTIVVQGRVKALSPPLIYLDCKEFENHRYTFEIDEGRGFELLKDPFIEDPPLHMEAGVFQFKQKVTIPSWLHDDNWFELDAVAFEIDGIVRDGAVLRVTYTGKVCGHWETLGRDEMVLRQGLPKVTFGSNQYAVGETAILRTEIPFVTFDDGNFTEYYLSVYNENTGDECKDDSGLLLDRVPIEKVKKTWKIPVTSDMFVVTATCQNRLRAIVRNELLNADQDDTSVIDIAGYGPVVTKVESDKAEYQEGDMVTITWEAKPNAITGLAIVKYHITAHIAGLPLMDQDMTETTATFRAPTTGFLAVEITAYDSGCRPSPIFDIEIEVGNVLPPKFCELYPDDPLCQDRAEPFPWLEILLTIGILILAFIVGYVLYLALIGLGETARGIAFLLSVFIGAILAGLVWL